ncbi:MAG: hypothetical protein HFACDABA_00175 [Anaerolineales bacterium]|nr:hypothetical protein [Anaerolineales bacterium]
MKSKWIEYNGKKIFFQDFANHFHNAEAVKQELEQVQAIVKAEPPNSVLVLSDFRNTSIGRELLPIMNAASAATKKYVKRTAVLGVTGIKRVLADMLSQMTGQPLKYFDEEFEAKDWLAGD